MISFSSGLTATVSIFAVGNWSTGSSRAALVTIFSVKSSPKEPVFHSLLTWLFLCQNLPPLVIISKPEGIITWASIPFRGKSCSTLPCSALTTTCPAKNFSKSPVFQSRVVFFLNQYLSLKVIISAPTGLTTKVERDGTFSTPPDASNISRWIKPVPMFEVQTTMVFLKEIVLPLLSVNRPSSKSWIRILKTSGWAFSISSRRTTE